MSATKRSTPLDDLLEARQEVSRAKTALQGIEAQIRKARVSLGLKPWQNDPRDLAALAGEAKRRLVAAEAKLARLLAQQRAAQGQALPKRGRRH